MTNKNSTTHQRNYSKVGKTDIYVDIDPEDFKQNIVSYNFSREGSLEHNSLVKEEYLESNKYRSLIPIITRLILDSDSILSSTDVTDRIAELIEPMKQKIQYDIVKRFLDEEAEKKNGRMMPRNSR